MPYTYDPGNHPTSVSGSFIIDDKPMRRRPWVHRPLQGLAYWTMKLSDWLEALSWKELK